MKKSECSVSYTSVTEALREPRHFRENNSAYNPSKEAETTSELQTAALKAV